MNSVSSVEHFERLCSDFYAPSNESSRRQAQDILTPIASSVEATPQLQSILATTSNQHALVFCATALTKLVSSNWHSITDEQKSQISSFMQNYLYENCGRLNQQISPYLIRFLCRVVKLSWLDGPKHQMIVQEMQRFFNSDSAHYLLGLEIYSELVSELNLTAGPQVSRFRRVALSFRDGALLSILETNLTSLRNIHSGALPFEEPVVRRMLRVLVVGLNFDFLGSVPDETDDHLQAVMIPHSFSSFRDPLLPVLLFSIYEQCVKIGAKSAAILALQSLVLIASFRRSFYQKEDDRNKITSHFLQGTGNLMNLRIGLSDRDCFHEMCRLIGKVRVGENLTEFLEIPGFTSWLENVLRFTSEALNSGEGNSLIYLAMFWSSLAPAAARLANKSEAPLSPPSVGWTSQSTSVSIPIQQVIGFVKQVTAAFIESRIRQDDDVLEDEVLRTEQLEVVLGLSCAAFDDTASVILQIIGRATSLKDKIWAVYMASMLVASQGEGASRKMVRIERPGSSELEIVGALGVAVISLMTSNSSSSERLELAFLASLEALRRVYLTEHAKSASSSMTDRKESRLAGYLGLNDEESIVTVMVSKAAANIQNLSNYEAVIKRSLLLFSDLCSSVTFVEVSESVGPQLIQSGRLLLSNPAVQTILNRHATSEFRTFLDNPKLGKYRTTYYHTLGKLIFLECRASGVDAKNVFQNFCAPMTESLWTLWQGHQQNLNPDIRLLTGLCRDLRGLSIAAVSSDGFELLFKYLVDDPRIQGSSKFTLFSAQIQRIWNQPEVVLPVLKFVADFVQNRQGRITFEQNSPGGLLLFREACKVVIEYGSKLLNHSGATPANLYKARWKGIAICLRIFLNTLTGNYANLGMFDMYGDPILSNSFSICVRMLVALPVDEVMSYLKNLKVVFALLEHITKSNMNYILDTEMAISHSLRLLEEGLTSFDSTVAMQACGAVDNIGTYFIEHPDAAVRFPNLAENLGRILSLVIQLFVSGEFSSVWSLSRVLFVLGVLEKNNFVVLSQDVVQAQILQERRLMMVKGFESLFAALGPDTSSKARETFTRNCYDFSQAIKTGVN